MTHEELVPRPGRQCLWNTKLTRKIGKDLNRHLIKGNLNGWFSKPTNRSTHVG